MNSKKDLILFYKDTISTHTKRLLQLKKQKLITAYSRAILFFVAIANGYLFNTHSSILIAILITVPLLIFFVLVARSLKLGRQITLLTELININKNEIASLEGDFSSFYEGKEYIAYDHPFSYDLDIFGEGSIYQYINRTATYVGRNKLAEKMQNPLTDGSTIKDMQEAIKNLKNKVKWRQLFQASGNIAIAEKKGGSAWFKPNLKAGTKTEAQQEISEWLTQEPLFANKKALLILLNIVPFVSVTMLIGVFTGILSATIFSFWGVVLLSIMAIKMKDVNQLHNRTGQKFSLLKNYAELIRQIEEEDFESKKLNQLKQQLSTNNTKASASIKQLATLLTSLDNRLNIIFAIIANGLFLWDLQYAYRIEQWQLKHKEQLPIWFEVFAEYDALSSFANFAFNHPTYTFPNISDQKYLMSLKEAGHPLLPDDVRVNNDFELNGKGNFSIITGANMAGKSTFLRTVGVNIILAGSGSVVCAKEFNFSPIKMHTSIRTNDSLQKSESYFYAELKRLHSIIERLEAGEELFVIVDEMLRGTNSKDKHHGSMAFSEQLSQQNAIGLIATHDIGLGNLSEKYPGKIKSNRFEVNITNDKLHFDYKLQTGVSQNLNATFLMKKMGIIKEI